MLTYVLIGLGGAIGSVARAWLGAMMMTLTGPTFPWGTILINVAGSFVIGLFGTLTATEGRFAVPSDLRAFVMVGICGGFTTFSSFSLQTLDLLRDGRAGQALGNIVLSVTLCIGSVAAGYSAGLAARTARFAVVGVAAPGAMGDRTVVALHRSEAVQPMLAMAARLMSREGDRTVALAIDGPAMASLQPTEELLTEERRREISRARMEWVQAMRPTLDRWVERERTDGHQARWIEIHGDGALSVVEHGRGAHLLLLEHDPDDPTARAWIHAALTRARRPVLLVPAAGARDITRVIAVAWEDEEQPRRAVRAAMPLLSKAVRVMVLHVGAPEGHGMPDMFHGMPAEFVSLPDDGDIGETLLSAAREAGAGLLVMGSYSYGILHEKLFDGVTESILRNADLPVLIQPQGA